MPKLLDYLDIELSETGRETLTRKAEQYTPGWLEKLFPKKMSEPPPDPELYKPGPLIRQAPDKNTTILIIAGVSIFALLLLRRKRR